MKKRIILLSTSLLHSIFLIAQPTMTENAIPQIGTVISGEFHIGELDLGDNGPNKEWIFEANPTIESYFTDILILEPEESPEIDLFPSTEMIMYIEDIGVYNYLRVEDNQLQSLGFSTAFDGFAILRTNIPNGEAIGTWPFTYGDTLKTESNYTTFYGETPFGGGTRKHTAVADSYGTVTTPYGTFENILKVSINYDESPDDIDQVLFLHPSTFLPLVRYDIGNSDGLNPGYQFYDISSISTTSTIESETSFTLRLDGQTILIDNLNYDKQTDILLSDIAGSQHPIDIKTVENGIMISPKTRLQTNIYVVSIKTGNKTSSLKIFIP